jgi:hypothetical protein
MDNLQWKIQDPEMDYGPILGNKNIITSIKLTTSNYEL